MGTVYRAMCEQLGKRFAIKTLDTDIKVSELVERFAREAQATAAIRHENVVELVDFGQTSECVYFVMELLEGYVLLERAALSDRETLDVTITALELGADGRHLLRGCADASPEQRGAWLRALERQAIDPGSAMLEHALASEQPDELAAGLTLLCMHEAREQHAHAVLPHLFAQEPDVRSAAIVAGLVRGLPQAPILLAQTARRPGMFVAALLHAIQAKPKQLDALIGATPLSEDLAFALALCGRPRAIAAVIDFVGSSASPRLLAGLRWSTGFAGLPAQLPSWWAEHRAASRLTPAFCSDSRSRRVACAQLCLESTLRCGPPCGSSCSCAARARCDCARRRSRMRCSPPPRASTRPSCAGSIANSDRSSWR
jgi:hypothetical protein